MVKEGDDQSAYAFDRVYLVNLFSLCLFHRRIIAYKKGVISDALRIVITIS